MKKFIGIIFVGLMMGCAGTEVHDAEDAAPEIRTITFGTEELAVEAPPEVDEPADGRLTELPTWNVKKEGVQLHVVTTLRAKWTMEGPRWVLRGRVEPAPQAIVAHGHADAEIVARVNGEHFELALDRVQALDVISGYALDLKLQYADETRDAHVRFKPAFRSFEGSSALWVYRWIHGVQAYSNEEQRVFRARAGTRAGFGLESVWSDSDVEGAVHPDVSGQRWVIDFEPDAILLASFAPGLLYFNVVDSDEKRDSKMGQVEFRLVDLRMAVATSSACEESVEACLNELSAEAFDSEACGLVIDVEPCNDLRGFE